MTRHLAVPFVLLALAGCSTTAHSPVAGPSGAATASASASLSTPTAPAPTSSATVSASHPTLVLEGADGLGVLDAPPSTHITHLNFATTTPAQITAALQNTLGQGAAQDEPNCGQGPRTSYKVGGFKVLFDGSKWVGYEDTGNPKSGASDLQGVMVGVTLDFIKQALDVDVSTGSLGPQFASKDGKSYAGLLTGTKGSDTVTALWVGETCHAS